ncbi:MAG: putative acyl-CoA dehydrogenase [Acidimicrobiia bacterium]|nr:putative acyl-CoA dehydrogenase [Acidimicrobiia bacterium]
MNLDVSASDAAFREEVRTWLHENGPKEPRPRHAKAMREFDLAWQKAQWEGGWAGIDWPVEYGGRGLSLLQQVIWYEEYAKLGLPGIDSRFVGNSHAGPTLISRASEEHKNYHLPKILRGEVVWCQGFSEPEAGSDLASLQTSAIVDGDHLVVNGQKLWTSFAEVADWQELLVRTDRDVPKHRGITWVICDMHSPGIEVRPIDTIDGGREFAEVFYNEVRIPMSNVVGAVNDGWSVAMSTLSFERGTAFTLNQMLLSEAIEELIKLVKDNGGVDDVEVSRALAGARAEVAALRAMTYMGVSRNAVRPEPGPEGSMLKLYFADLGQRIYRLAEDILGSEGMRLRTNHGAGEKDWVGDYLMSYSFSIGGGTSEIMKNIIGERVLGLPR